ncbi:reverse transcriptase domain-containing protein, partial [Shigella flexneri]|nr:reverse transcriptase domain-containing protein [Shigella flexneri]
IKGINIGEGVLVANELIDHARRSQHPCFLLKVDFQKAFDTIEWSYLYGMMNGMGFPRKWINWMAECLSTVTASILVNGSPTKEFQLHIGLR